MKPQQSSNKTYLCYQNSLSDDYELVDDDDDDDEEEGKNIQKEDIWSEIPLNTGTMSASNSTSSSNYSQNSDCDEKVKNEEVATSSDNNKDTNKDDDKKSGGLSEWLSKSSFRRQSLEDVFAQSTLFGKFGRSGERRNSESELESSSSSAKKEFFLFGRNEGLTDSQIDHFFLPDEHL